MHAGRLHRHRRDGRLQLRALTSCARSIVLEERVDLVDADGHQAASVDSDTAIRLARIGTDKTAEFPQNAQA
jgi:hypothetical protein